MACTHVFPSPADPSSCEQAASIKSTFIGDNMGSVLLTLIISSFLKTAVMQAACSHNAAGTLSLLSIMALSLLSIMALSLLSIMAEKAGMQNLESTFVHIMSMAPLTAMFELSGMDSIIIAPHGEHMPSNSPSVGGLPLRL
jgi:hypothetical protein